MSIERIAIFDFDGTLFASPEKPDWWPHQGFWGRIETLSPPLVPEKPEADWWSSQVVLEAKRAAADPSTHTCLLTGRVGKFEKRVRELLETVEIRFDDHFFASGSATLPFKLATIEKLVQRSPGAKLVEMWDDRHEHAEDFETTIQKLGLEANVHRVERVIHEFVRVG
jgi:hypothetical protein